MMTEQEARETIELRALLEGQNARLAARHQDQQTLKRVEVVLNKGTAAVAAKRFDQLSDLNQEFHRESPRQDKTGCWANSAEAAGADRNAVLAEQSRPGRPFVEQHAAILRAIIEGDERAAATLAAEHVIHAGTDFLFGLNTDREVPLYLLGERDGKQRAGLAQKSSTADADRPASRRRNSVSKTKPRR